MKNLSNDSTILAIADARRQWQEIASHAQPHAPVVCVRPSDYVDDDIASGRLAQPQEIET